MGTSLSNAHKERIREWTILIIVSQSLEQEQLEHNPFKWKTKSEGRIPTLKDEEVISARTQARAHTHTGCQSQYPFRCALGGVTKSTFTGNGKKSKSKTNVSLRGERRDDNNQHGTDKTRDQRRFRAESVGKAKSKTNVHVNKNLMDQH